MKRSQIIFYIFCGIVFVFWFLAMFYVIEPNDYESFCEVQFGEQYYYESARCENSNKCARECVRADIDPSDGQVTLTSKYFLLFQYKEVCRERRFFHPFKKQCEGDRQ